MINKKHSFKNEKTPVKLAIAGNPNVGKSTIFNALTGMHQHTGNWPGKTVSNATGNMKFNGNSYKIIDIPGTYSFYPHSAEEEIARDYLISNDFDAVLVVCDAGCIEKNLNFVLQVIEACENVIVCINLVDEAKRKGITVDEKALSAALGVPVIKIIAQKKEDIKRLKLFIDDYFNWNTNFQKIITSYPDYIEEEIESISSIIEQKNARFFALKILEGENYCLEKSSFENVRDIVEMSLKIKGKDFKKVKEDIIASKIKIAKNITENCVKVESENIHKKDMLLDRILTGKFTAIPIMLIMVAFVFWVTIKGANFLSDYLSEFMFFAEDKLYTLLNNINTPEILKNSIVFGGFRVLAWVVSVMLPPMAIFFPFFTILEDTGYLARIAYNLDKPFYCCNACGKQALTMCMGFGCNSVGVTGARIIDSKRERLLAIITNNFMPCNGRFPMLITFITIFFVGIEKSGEYRSVLAAILLALLIFFSVLISFLITKLLSVTLLKGVSSSYILELPSYRRPNFCKIIIRSIFDRTLFVLGRAVAVALPAGFLIWFLSNIEIGDVSILNHMAKALNPVGNVIGLDGVILLAFILGTPANEIVVPLMLMIYLESGTIAQIGDYSMIKNILLENGWDISKAVCTVLFTIFHWPCATTLLTIKKETGSVWWTLVAATVPTVVGALLCIIVSFLLKIFL